MSEIDARRERLHVFRLDERYVFSHFFERRDLFDDLREYYEDDAYRFEVPVDEFEAVRERLREARYEPAVVDDAEAFAVVTGKYDPHAAILRESVANWERRGHRFFLMRDRRAVEAALERGATRLEETDFVLGV